MTSGGRPRGGGRGRHRNADRRRAGPAAAAQEASGGGRSEGRPRRGRPSGRWHEMPTRPSGSGSLAGWRWAGVPASDSDLGGAGVLPGGEREGGRRCGCTDGGGGAGGCEEGDWGRGEGSEWIRGEVGKIKKRERKRNERRRKRKKRKNRKRKRKIKRRAI